MSSSTPPPRLYHGAAWYPEQIDPASWREDVRSMNRLGLNVVRLGEFAWSRLEPQEGRFNTGWLVEALDLLHEHGIRAVVGTPSATPPQWLLNRHPEIGYVDDTGHRHRHGGRQHACYNHPLFRQHSNRIAAEVARAVGRHPALVAWQIDNELRGHQKICLCEACARGWAAWLRHRHGGSLARLNAEWGTEVWSHAHEDFTTVPQPYKVPTWSHSYPVLINYRRFMSDSAIAFLAEQVAAVRAHSAAPITHNSEDSVDEHALFAGLDFAGVDIYVGHSGGPDGARMRLDSFRAVKPGRRFWTMETGSGDPLLEKAAPPGWLSCFAFLHYASGAEAFLYWPWRQHRTGTEIGHPALLYTCGKPSPAWAAAEGVEAMRRALEPILDEYRPAPAPVALVRSESNGHYFFSDRVGGLEANFAYRARLAGQYHALTAAGAWRDVIFDTASFDGYRVIFSPYLPWASDDFLRRMERHLELGGAWVVGPYCGYRERDHTVPTNAIFGAVEKMLGIETRSFGAGHGAEVVLRDGTRATTAMQVAIFGLSAPDEVIGRYDDGPFAGQAWGITRTHGRGRVYVLGSELDDAARERLHADILRREGVVLSPMPPRVWLCPQTGRDGRQAWALTNWGEEERRIELPRTGVDLLGQRPAAGSIALPAFSNAFLAFDA